MEISESFVFFSFRMHSIGAGLQQTFDILVLALVLEYQQKNFVS